MAAPYKQDLPPKGGYQSFKFAKNLPKRGPSGFVIFIGGIATMGVGFFLLAKGNREKKLVAGAVPL